MSDAPTPLDRSCGGVCTGLSFRPMKPEVVVIMRGEKVAGTIRRYRAHHTWIICVPGILSAAANPGRVTFTNLADAKRAVLDAARAYADHKAGQSK